MLPTSVVVRIAKKISSVKDRFIYRDRFGIDR